MNDFEMLSDAIEKRHVKTDILDKYMCVIVSKNTIFPPKEIYKVCIGRGENILKVVNIDTAKRDSSERLTRIRECFNTMKKLGSEHPYFIYAYDRKEIYEENNIRIETLMEEGGRSLFKLMEKATNDEIIEWILQSISAFAYTEQCGICHFDIKPENMVFKNGILKVIDLDSSVEFQQKEDLYKKLRESGKMAYEFTKVYAPDEAKDINNVGDWIGGKFDVFCWGLSFFQIITKKKIKEINLIRKSKEQDEEYLTFIDEIYSNKQFYEIDEKGIIQDIIAKCISHNIDERPTFRKIAEALRGIEKKKHYNNPPTTINKFINGKEHSDKIENSSVALLYSKNCIHIINKLPGKDNLVSATAYFNIACEYYNLGDKIKALEYHKKH